MKEPTLKINRIFRKAPAVRGLDVQKHTKIYYGHKIIGKVELTKEEEMKAKYLVGVNHSDHGFITLKEQKNELFTPEELKEIRLNPQATTIKRGCAIAYNDGINIDFCVAPHFTYNEHYFITDSRQTIYGTVTFGDDKINVNIFKKTAKNGEIINLGSKGILSSSNHKACLSFSNESELKNFLATLNLSNLAEEENEL